MSFLKRTLTIAVALVAAVILTAGVIAGEMPEDECGIEVDMIEDDLASYIEEYVESTNWEDAVMPTSDMVVEESDTNAKELAEQESAENPEVFLNENRDEQDPVGSNEENIVTDPTVEETEMATYYSGSSVSPNNRNFPQSPFVDLQDASHSYYDGICFLGNNGISKGYPGRIYGTRTYQSSRSCTRGEAICLLWKLKGQPAPKAVTKTPFKDVPKTHSFYRAILWASQKGITKGYSDGTFGINKTCTRGHVMMFLWRSCGKPSASGGKMFSDVKPVHPYYKAVAWGSATGITKGFSDGTFGLNYKCNRGQIATFLYRYYLNMFYTVQMRDGKIETISCPIHRIGGKNYERVLDANKKLIDLPTVPKKVLFVGNSLLQGLGGKTNSGRFGMSAQDSRHDYYYYVTQAILKQYGQASFSKLSGTAFEGSTDAKTAQDWYERQKASFTNDLDLVIIQLGDNANTDAKQAAFKKNYGQFLKQIKTDCPKARIVCIATWYSRAALVSAVADACKANGCDFISIADLYHDKANFPTEGYRVTFNDGTTAILSGGALTHPNNRAMQLIAQRIIAMLRLS